MKKRVGTLSIIVGLTLSGVALASDAVLNVEGEVQINGETVIDSSGNWVGNTSTSSQTASVKLSDYYPGANTVVTTFDVETQDSDQEQSFKRERVTATATTEKVEQSYDEGSSFELVESLEKDGNKTTITEEGMLEEQTYSYLVPLPAELTVGQVYSRIANIDLSCSGAECGYASGIGREMRTYTVTAADFSYEIPYENTKLIFAKCIALSRQTHLISYLDMGTEDESAKQRAQVRQMVLCQNASGDGLGVVELHRYDQSRELNIVKRAISVEYD
ncbi:hypothetical protein [Vibrio sp. WXL103]|uniref:hypothetical protein n=1 Tax=Vibrio sp. WXL103 TaxID=3450710 RepID=UPI003EC5C1AB